MPNPLIVPFDGTSPVIAESAWVAPNATLVGNVSLGAEASVFFGAVVRGDVDGIRIGDRSNIQDNVSVHCDSGIPTTVGAGVSVGHSAVLHGCTVEDDCLIGMSATVLNHAVIGAGSLVAAGSVVLEGTVVPPNSLVAGVPAKVRRELTDAEHAKLLSNADHYVELSRTYRTP
jgi:carbonic anhydrase/acetyltransferase-like protein (isoleucine patch superfamily)